MTPTDALALADISLNERELGDFTPKQRSALALSLEGFEGSSFRVVPLSEPYFFVGFEGRFSDGERGVLFSMFDYGGEEPLFPLSRISQDASGSPIGAVSEWGFCLFNAQNPEGAERMSSLLSQSASLSQSELLALSTPSATAQPKRVKRIL